MHLIKKNVIDILFSICLLSSSCLGADVNNNDVRIIWGKVKLDSTLARAGINRACGLKVQLTVTVNPTSAQLPDSIRKPEAYAVNIKNGTVNITGFP